MKIGVDIDGTLTSGKSLINWLCRYFGVDRVYGDQEYDLLKVYNLTHDQWRRFCEAHMEDVYRDSTPRPNAVETMIDWHAKGHEICLITARDAKHGDITAKWLERYGIPYDKIYHTTDKKTLCLVGDIKVIIEDNLYNASECAKAGINAILVAADYNKTTDCENLKRVDSWSDVAREVASFE